MSQLSLPEREETPPRFLGDVRERLEKARASGPQDLLLEASLLIEEVTGHTVGMTLQKGEYQGVDKLDEPGAEEALKLLMSAMEEALRALHLQGKDQIPYDTYLCVAQEWYDDRVSERQDRERAGSEHGEVTKGTSPGYELDLGDATMTGPQAENRFLYSSDKLPTRPSEVAMQRMCEAERVDPRDHYHKNQEYLQEVREQDPYKEKAWDPGSEWLADIQVVLMEEFHLDSSGFVATGEWPIRMMPCVGTRADILRGTDCVVEFHDPVDGSSVAVTIDVTSNLENKAQGGVKADVVVSPQGALIHKDFELSGARQFCVDPRTLKIDHPQRNERRKLIAKAIAEIIRFRKAHRDIPIFRTPRNRPEEGYDPNRQRRRDFRDALHDLVVHRRSQNGGGSSH